MAQPPVFTWQPNGGGGPVFGAPFQRQAPGTPTTQQHDPFADPQPGFFGGFISSAASAIPELFGMQPFETAQTFRQQNPISGFASQLLGTAVPYAGWARATMLPRLAGPLEAATAGVAGRIGLNMAEAPIRTGIIRESLRFLPLDVTGAVARDYAEDGDIFDSRMFADIGLGLAITGGIGALGGYIRAGGRRGPQPSYVNAEEGSSLLLTPTHQLDALMRGAEIVGPTSRDDLRVALRNEVLTEQTARGTSSNVPLPYITRLEGSSGPDEIAAINSLFEVRGRGNRTTMRQLLAEGPENNRLTLNPGQQEQVVRSLGFESIDELARNTIFPRVINVQSRQGAEALNGILQRPSLRSVGEGTFLAREPEGAFVIAKRVAAGGGEQVGVVREADQWLVARTTNPGAFVREAAAIGDTNMAQWARWRQQWQPRYRDNPFDRSHDTLLAAMTPLDIADMRRMTRSSWVNQMTKKLGASATDLAAPGARAGIRDSATLRNGADWLYDTFAPTMFQEARDSRFARFFGLMRNAIRTADMTATRFMQGGAKIKGSPSQAIRGKNIEYVSAFHGYRPARAIADDLTADEVNLIMHASAGSDLPEAALRELMESGQLSSKAIAAVQEYQAMNRTLLDEYVLPAIKDLPQTADVKWLEGYIMPRLYRGDWRVMVKNEKGQDAFLAAGKTPAQAQAEARAVVEEAAARGRNWRIEEARMRHTVDPDSADIAALQDQLVKRLASNQDDAQLVYSAMRKLAAQKATTGRNPSIPSSTSTLKRRSGRPGSPDKQVYTHEDLLEAMDGHTRTLLRFAGMQAWRERFGRLAYAWGQDNPKAYENLMRKAQQYMGIEGQITNALNRTLEPVLGPVLGKKAATKIAAATNELMYMWNLAFVNPTFALLNLLTPLQTVAPWIAMTTRAPVGEVSKMMQFVPIFDNLGNVRGTGSVLEPMKVLKEATRMLRSPDEELRGMMERGIDDGVFSAQLYEEWVGKTARASQTMRDAFNQGGFVEFIRKGGTYMAEKSESYSRMVAFNSGYLVGKHHFGLADDALYRFARRTTETTMYQYGTVDRSRIFTGPIGSMFGLFKNWQFHFIGNMLDYAGLALKHNVWSPLIWSTAAATTLGGLGATPLKNLADGLANWYGGEDTGYEWLRQNWGYAGDAVYFGLPAFLGVSLQASSSIPGTDVRNELNSLGSFVILERMKKVGEALGDSWNAQLQGQSAMADPNIRDKLIAALAPRMVFRAVSAMEGEYVRSMSTGYPMVQNVSPAGRILHGLGMNVVEVERMQVFSRELYRDKEARRVALDTLGASFADAQMNGDTERVYDIIRRGIAQGIPVDSLIQSSRTRLRRESGDILSQFSAEEQARVRAMIGEGAVQQTWQPGMPR